MWSQLKLKAEEVAYFRSQLEAHSRHPTIFLFYLSAFLSSARSVTFHLQKRVRKKDDGVYEALRQEFLADAVCSYFVNMRNYSEKEGYPPLLVCAQVGRKEKDNDRIVWTVHASCQLFSSNDSEGLRFIQNYQHDEWDFTSAYGPSGMLRLVYRFPDFPEPNNNVIALCRAFSDRLWAFLASYRWRWEQQHDPDAAKRKFDKWLSSDYDLPDA